MVAETERLLLRRLRMDDLDSMCEVLCNPEVMRFSLGVKARADVLQWLSACVEAYARTGFGIWGVVEKSSKVVVGYCGLTQHRDIDGQPEVEIGFRLARGYWSRGFATEVALAVRDHARQSLSIPRLVALVDPDNAASARVVEKIGMTHEKDVMLPGYDYPDRLYAMPLVDS